MAVQTTEEFKNGGATSYAITIEYLQASDIKVRIGGTLQTYTTGTPGSGEYSVSGTTVTLGAAAPSGSGNVHIYRETDVNTAAATFAAGSSIRAADLNAIHDMGRFAAVEHRNKIITANIKAGAVTSTEIADDTIVNADINASAAIDNSKIADGLLKSGITVNSANIVDGSIVDADVNNNANIAGTKISPNFGSQVITTSGNIVVGGTVDGRDVAGDGTKLDTIETNAKDDQTGSEIKALYEAQSNTNAYTDAEKTKLSGIETGATADQTNAEIKTAYEANADTNEFSDAEQSKLAGIETAATADQTAGEIKTLLQSDKLTLSEMNTTSLDSRYYTETEAEAKFLRQDSSETIASGATWSNSDAFVATTAAINARIIDLIDEVGGFTAIANQTSFPATNPQGATGQSAILSIAATTATLTPSSGTITIPNGAGTGNTVTITGAPTIPQNFGFLVESTSTLHTYSFHRLVPIATQVNTVAQNITNIVQAGANVADINNFADIYQISGSAPTQRADGTSLQDGDLWFNNSNDDLRVWNGSTWAIITPAQSVLDDVAIVSGAITYSEDLGLISDAVTTGTSNGSLDIVADILEDEATFTVTAAGGAYFIDGASKPALTLYKGWTYTFDLSSNTLGSHPLRFYAGSSQYSTNVTVTGTQGQAGAKISIKIPETQPSNFQYYCTNHSGMGNTITVKDDPIKTVSDNISSINTVSTNVNNVNTTASAISNVNMVGNAIADVNRYANEYTISASQPSSPSNGDLWYDTTNDVLKNYNGTIWAGITSNSGIASVVDDTTPQLGGALDAQNNNLNNVGTIDGSNLQLDFGTL